jgi:glycosyltransferase involved in cell wall biosynthesis
MTGIETTSSEVLASTGAPDISVVMPCLNEAGSVGICVAKAFEGIRLSGLSGEVVVADNGSDDGSVEIARQAGARVVHQPLRGYGNAYLKGFAEARGRIVVMGDSDDSYDFTQIPTLIAPINDGADYVLGSRFRGRIEPGAMTWSHRYIGNPVLTRMLNLLFGLQASDAHSGLRAFRREALEQMSLRSEGMEFASEIVVKAAKAQLEVAEVPIVYHPRIGDSKLNSLRDAWRHIRFLLLLSPLRVFVLPGVLLFGAGLVGQGALLAMARSQLGVHLSSLAVCVMLLGMQFLVVGLFTKAYAHQSGLEADPSLGRGVNRALTVERGLLTSAVLGLIGVVCALAPFVHLFGGRDLQQEMAASGFGFIILAAQLAFCTYFLAFFRVPLDRKGTARAIVLP